MANPMVIHHCRILTWTIPLRRQRPRLRYINCIQQSHFFSSDAISSFLLPPVVFAGLLVTLWTWKCLAMVIFQRKIIYMPGIPPYARRERIAEYAQKCGGIKWREEKVQSADGTNISLCVADTDPSISSSSVSSPAYILYFQGNAGSIPMRLPMLSPILNSLRALEHDDEIGRRPIRYTIVCPSYRGYWTSQNRRQSEKGLGRDAEAGLKWIMEKEKKIFRIPVTLWGQSLGCGVATNCAAQQFPSERFDLRSLILETPFTSIPDMLVALYPQKWLPYRYLKPFLLHIFDSSDALKKIATNFASQGVSQPKVLILQAERDELVPPQHGEVLEKKCQEVGIPVERKIIKGALHNEVMFRSEALQFVVKNLRRAFQ